MSLAPRPENSTTPGDNTPFPGKEARQRCWKNRDVYWECLDKHPGDQEKAEEKCSQFRELFEKNCPHAWVTHFDRRRRYEAYKEKFLKEGPDPVTQKPSS